MDPFKFSIRNSLGKKDKYRVCAGPGFTSIHRLREHLQRVHRPHQCSRCFSIFDKEKELHDHAKSPVCQISSESQQEGIDTYKWERICTRGRKFQTNPERWYEIWDILFPDKPRPSHYWYTQYDNTTLDPDRLVAIFKDKIESDISQGFIKAHDSSQENIENAQEAQEQLVGRMIQALRDSIATPEAHHRIHFSEGIPSKSTSNPIDSEETGASKTRPVNLAVSWLDQNAKPANAPGPYSEPDSSSEISPFFNLLPSKPMERSRPASEILKPVTSSKTSNSLTTTTSNRPCSWEATHSETMAGIAGVIVVDTSPQQSFPSGHNVVTDELLEGSSSSNGLPTDIGLGVGPSRDIAVGPSEPFTRHVCSTCQQSFSRESDLRRHSAKHKPDAELYHCTFPGCLRSGAGKGFHRADKLRDHMSKRHGVAWR